MSLSSALNTANGVFTNTSAQMAVVSKNISNASNADYSRRDAQTVATQNGATLAPTFRASNQSLTMLDLSANTAMVGQQTLDDGLSQLQSILGGNDYSTAPSTYLSKMQSSLQSYSASPSNTTLAQSVVSGAKDLANALNNGTTSVQKLRGDADASISVQVSKLNDLLAQFKVANDEVKGGTATGQDVNDSLDKRDKLLKGISSIIGVQSITRTNNDMVLYTSDGTTLFETSPRDVTFQAKSAYDATTTGNAVYVDGVALNAGVGGNSSAQGSLQAYLQLRDTIAPTYQTQLDELARGLITAFSEKDQSGSGQPDLPGLFTWSGGTVPDEGVLVNGIASTISVNPAVDASVGGDASKLRDGGMNGADYVSNTDAAQGYSALLQEHLDALTNNMAFDPASELNSSQSLTSYSSSSIGWFEELRSQSSNSLDTKNAAATTSTSALSNAVGVSLDEELSKLLDLEQSYKASAKIVSTVDSMMQALMAAAG